MQASEQQAHESVAVTPTHRHAIGDRLHRVDDFAVALWVFAIGAAIGFVALPHIDIQGIAPVSDGRYYWLTAQHPHTFYTSPFSNRVLTPWIVSALPFRVQTGFATLTVLSLAGSAATLYVYARTFVERSAAFRAVAFFAVAGGVLWLLLDPYLVDGPTLFLTILTFLLVRRGNLGWATVTLSAGVVNHEYALFVIAPLVVAYLVENRRLTARLAPFVVFPVLVYVLIHHTPVIYGRVPPSSLQFGWSFKQWQVFMDEGAAYVGGLRYAVLFAVAGSFGSVWALALLGLRHAPRFLRATALLIPLIFVTFLGNTDAVRYLTLAIPAVVVLACRVPIRWSVLVALLAVQTTIGVLALSRISATYSNHFGHRYALATLVLFSFALMLILGDRLLHPRGASSTATPDHGQMPSQRRQIDETMTPNRPPSASPARRMFLSRGMLITAVTAGLVVIGFASFSTSDFRNAAREAVAAGTNKNSPATPPGPIVGRINAIHTQVITITRPNGTDLPIYASAATVINKAIAGSSADVTLGSTILVKGELTNGDIDATESEVIVLPAGTRFGAAAGLIVGQVNAVDENTIMITRPNGNHVKINNTSTTLVEKATAGTPIDLTMGSMILVQGKLTYIGVNATKGALIVIPPGSRFAAA